MDQLKDYSSYLHVFLEALSLSQHPSALDYQDWQVSLYAEYDPDRLLSFLKDHSQYNVVQVKP
jgi:hypothetical protein